MQNDFNYYLLSTLLTSITLNVQEKLTAVYEVVMEIYEIFDCGFKFTYVGLCSQTKDFASAFLILIIRDFISKYFVL